MDESIGGRNEKTSQSEWLRIIDGIISQVEIVSEHFGYKEEYVLDHSVSWLNRKYEQAMKSQYESHSMSVLEGFKSLLLVIDMAFNKGRGWQDILPPSYEDMLEKEQEKAERISNYVTDIWWGKR